VGENGDMPLPLDDTLVSYPGGALSERAAVLHVEARQIDAAADRIYLITDRSCVHPVDPRWPDQGPDIGTITIAGQQVALLDCVIGATDGASLFVGDDVPVRRGEPGWAFLVVHAVAAVGPLPVEGDDVVLTVDAAHRAALSAGHTGCHVAALALNTALADRWRKPVATDGLGHPDFDQLAIVSSRITPDGAVDTYRLGRSLRKKGFDVEGLDAALPAISAEANGQLAAWVATGTEIDVEISGPRLTDLREWVCALPGGTQRIACGGTHLRSLAEVDSIAVQLAGDVAAGELVMTTTVQRR
jgi:alanyl-tRNA synthetase